MCRYALPDWNCLRLGWWRSPRLAPGRWYGEAAEHGTGRASPVRPGRVRCETSLVWFAVYTSWHLAGNEITFDPDVRKELCGN